MTELDQLEAATNNNYMPDDAFTSEPAEAFQVEDKPASAFTPKYEDLTLEQKFAANKEAVYKKHQVDTSVKGPTVADALQSASNSKFQVHADGSMTVKKGVMGNERDSMSMIEVLREQAYQRHDITE